MMRPDHHHSLLVVVKIRQGYLKMKKVTKKKIKLSLIKKSSCKQCGSSKENYDDYKLDRHNKDTLGVEVLKPVNAYLTKAINFETFHLTLQSKNTTAIFLERELNGLNIWM